MEVKVKKIPATRAETSEQEEVNATDLQNVIRVKETTSEHEVNLLLKDGWMLIRGYTRLKSPEGKHLEIVYALGELSLPKNR